MAVIQMPCRGKKDETGMITSWHKKTGDWVAEGDELFSFDTDDGTYTVKSQKAGRLVAIFVPEGELVHCPADVGMLASTAPDSVLKMGRMQFVDESKPLSPREPEPQPIEEPQPETEEPQPKTAGEPPQEESAPPAEAAAVPQPEAEELQPEAAEPGAPEEMQDAEQESAGTPQPAEAEETSAQEKPEAPEEEAGLPVTEEELLQSIPDETEEIPAVEQPAWEEDAPEPPAVPEEPEAAAEPAAPEMPEAAAQPEAPVPPRPACLTAQADMSLCMDIVARTGVTVAAMVRFAAMHTDAAALLDEVADGTLRGMSGRELPNVLDLTGSGVTAAACAGDGALRFVVPDVHDAWRARGDGMESYPALNLSLCFDENAVSMTCAAGMLRAVCAHLENLLNLIL